MANHPDRNFLLANMHLNTLRYIANRNSRLQKIGAPAQRAPIPGLSYRGVRNSEEQFHRELRDARVAALSRAEGAKRAVVVQLVERADLISAIHSARADAFRG